MVNLLFYGGAFWLACIVFTIDLLIPSGVAVGLGYVVVVIVGIWSPSRKYYFWAAFIGSMLTILGGFVSQVTDEPMHRYLHWEDITNWILSIIVLWGFAFLLYKRNQGTVHKLKQDL